MLRAGRRCLMGTVKLARGPPARYLAHWTAGDPQTRSYTFRGARMTADPTWTRAPLDMLAHAYRHFRESSESAYRYALLGFDQAVEGSIAAFLRFGPGDADVSGAAVRAWRPRSNFWDKVNFLEAFLEGAARRIDIALDEITLIHDIRNDLQHDGGWFVPAVADVERARHVAVAVFEVLAETIVAPEFAPLPIAHVPSRRPTLSTSNAIRTPSPETAESGSEASTDRRQLPPRLYRLAKAEDPSRGGIHYTRLARLAERNNIRLAGADPGRTVYSALNNAHDLFERLAPGIYTWREPDGRDIHAGITGRTLADVVYAFSQATDPERRGLHYNHDIKDGLLRWGVSIRGADTRCPSRVR